MTQLVRDLMTPQPQTVGAAEPVANVAQLMRNNDVGAVVMVQGQTVRGIVTDRDIAIRAIADRKDPWNTRVDEIASTDLLALAPDDTVEQAITVMRDRGVRRLPVVDAGRPVGILSLGDVAIERDPTSVLAEISAAPANR